MLNTNLVDLDFFSNYYIWSNNRFGSFIVSIQLDRAISNVFSFLFITKSLFITLLILLLTTASITSSKSNKHKHRTKIYLGFNIFGLTIGMLAISSTPLIGTLGVLKTV